MPTSVTFYKAPRYLFRKHSILSILKSKPDITTFLDIGCGAGELACTLAEKGLKGVAVDFSKDAIKIANKMRDERKIKKADLQFKLGGLENVTGKKFDMVSCFEVLEHVEDDRKLLNDLVKHSKKYVLISVPARQHLYDASDEAVGHFRRYEKQPLVAMLADAGLEVTDFISYGYPFTDIVRVGRKLAFNAKLRRDKNASMKARSKGSGINPIKLPRTLSKVDLEKVIIPLYHASSIFNKRDLSEGYLVLAQKKG